MHEQIVSYNNHCLLHSSESRWRKPQTYFRSTYRSCLEWFLEQLALLPSRGSWGKIRRSRPWGTAATLLAGWRRWSRSRLEPGGLSWSHSSAGWGTGTALSRRWIALSGGRLGHYFPGVFLIAPAQAAALQQTVREDFSLHLWRSKGILLEWCRVRECRGIFWHVGSHEPMENIAFMSWLTKQKLACDRISPGVERLMTCFLEEASEMNTKFMSINAALRAIQQRKRAQSHLQNL